MTNVEHARRRGVTCNEEAGRRCGHRGIAGIGGLWQRCRFKVIVIVFSPDAYLDLVGDTLDGTTRAMAK